jgi:hypothetical protein
MRYLKAGVAGAVILMLAACAGISSGTVTAKHQEDAYYWTQMICSGYNQQGSCTVWVPITHHVDEKWVLSLENKEGDTGDVSVPENVYNTTDIGTIYTVPNKEKK